MNSIVCSLAYSTQHASLKLLQLWQKEIDDHGFVDTIFKDLSKAYDCISTELFITKSDPHATKNSLALILDKPQHLLTSAVTRIFRGISIFSV